MRTFVLSSKPFESIKEAEKVVQKWHDHDDLTPGTKLYEIKAVYDLGLKFTRRKK